MSVSNSYICDATRKRLFVLLRFKNYRSRVTELIMLMSSDSSSAPGTHTLFRITFILILVCFLCAPRMRNRDGMEFACLRLFHFPFVVLLFVYLLRQSQCVLENIGLRAYRFRQGNTTQFVFEIFGHINHHTF